jgi:ankyrin repeat protein
LFFLAYGSLDLQDGEDPEAYDHDDSTPFHCACCDGHSTVVIELMEHGSDIDAKDRVGWTPLHLGVIQGHLAVVKELMKCEADTELKTRNGWTPLHLAIIQGPLVIVEVLLNGGVDILAYDNQGDLPIHVAVGQGNTEASKYLLQHFYATTSRLPLHQFTLFALAAAADLVVSVFPDSNGALQIDYISHY